MTERTDTVLEAIDGAVRDYELSSDAMRWVREDARDDEPDPELFERPGHASVSFQIDLANFEAIALLTGASVQALEFEECTSVLRAVRHPLTVPDAQAILLRHQCLGFTPR